MEAIINYNKQNGFGFRLIDNLTNQFKSEYTLRKSKNFVFDLKFKS